MQFAWRDMFSEARFGKASFGVAVSGLAITAAGIAVSLSQRILHREACSPFWWHIITWFKPARRAPAVCQGSEAVAIPLCLDSQVVSEGERPSNDPAPTSVPAELHEPLAQRVSTAAEADDASVPATATDAAQPEESQPGQQAGAVRERLMGLRTLLSSLQSCDRVSPDSIMGPFQMNAGTDEVPVVCFQFRMSHFTCKAFLAHGTQDEGSQHLKLQTTFEDNRRSLGEEQRYFIANEWNATKRYTRLKCGAGGAGRSSVFTLEYDVLVPADTPHSWGLLLLAQTLRMWYTSMVACVMHIVEPRDVPFATHEMIMANTLSVTVREEDTCLQCQSCPICFESFKVGENVRRLPCMHLFHVVTGSSDSSQSQHCNIDKHLVRDKQCPVCKTSIDFMERKDKNASDGKVIDGEALVLLEGEDALGSAEASTQANATAVGTTSLLDLSPGTDGVAAAALASDGAEAGQSMAAVARGAAAHGIAAAAEVAAVVARIAPQQAQAQAEGLPAQAAELERAVRSLQSRWMQIQDVVAGMQQMLQYIEESQSMMSAARAEQQQQQQTSDPNVEPTGTDNATEAAAITGMELRVASHDGGDTGAAQPSADMSPMTDTRDSPEAMSNHLPEQLPAGHRTAAADFRTQAVGVEPMDVAADVPERAGGAEEQVRIAEAAEATGEDTLMAENAGAAPVGLPRSTSQGEAVEFAAQAAVNEVIDVNPSSADEHGEMPSRQLGNIVAEASRTQILPASLQSQVVPDTAAAVTVPRLEPAMTPVATQMAAPAATQVPAAPAATQVATEASTVMGFMQQALRVQHASPQQRDQSSSPSNGAERCQPFTEAEKLCMAYMWRWRRAQLPSPTATVPGEVGSGTTHGASTSS